MESKLGMTSENIWNALDDYCKEHGSVLFVKNGCLEADDKEIEEEPLRLELVRDGFDRYGAAEWRETENGTTFIGEVISSSLYKSAWNGWDNYDWTYGLCPECEKIDGFLSIGPLNFAFCLEHRLAWTHTWGAWDILADWYTPEVQEQNTEFVCRNFKQAGGWEKFESATDRSQIEEDANKEVRGNRR